jgi:hypothetical protein
MGALSVIPQLPADLLALISRLSDQQKQMTLGCPPLNPVNFALLASKVVTGVIQSTCAFTVLLF